MILSRLPVRQVLRHLLPWPMDPVVPSMQRIALEATLDTPQGLVRVTTTHLEYYSAWQRAAQVERLRELHREACAHASQPRPGTADDGPFDRVPRGAASILAGDFNFKPDSPEHVRLMTPIDPVTPPYRDAWECLHPGRPHAPTVGLRDDAPDAGLPFTFDYALVSSDLAGRVRRMRVDGSEEGPDHQALLLELA
jgi:endonuclease/exonuclease/phosphatase family metal-dependent hydrolase